MTNVLPREIAEDFIVLARILFRSPDFGTSWSFFTGLLDGGWQLPRFSMLAWTMFALGYLVHFSPDRWQDWAERRFTGGGPVIWVTVLGLAALACVVLGTGEQLAFIYYQF